MVTRRRLGLCVLPAWLGRGAWLGLCAWLCVIIWLCGLAGPAAARRHRSRPAAAGPVQVTILSPRDGAALDEELALLRVLVQLPAGAKFPPRKLQLRALVDGRPVPASRGLGMDSGQADPAPAQAGVVYSLRVPLTAPLCVVRVEAQIGGQVRGAASVRLLRAQRGAPFIDSAQRGGAAFIDGAAGPLPKLYVLSIGVGAYDEAELRLRFPAKDAADLRDTLAAQRGLLYRDVEVRLLRDRDATKGNILDGLEWLLRETTARDVAVLFLAGHGIRDTRTGSYYFLPVDAQREAMARTMIMEDEVRNTLGHIAGKVVVFLDTCHAGKLYRGVQGRGGAVDTLRFARELSRAENGVVVFAAASGQQESLESPEWGNGAFTRAVIEGLNGRADARRTGRVTLNMLELYVSERVKELTRGAQTPSTAKPETVSDFPLAIVRELRPDEIPIIR